MRVGNLPLATDPQLETLPPTRTEGSIVEEVARHVARRLHAQYRSGGIPLDHIPARGHDATKRLLAAAFGGSRQLQYAVMFDASKRMPSHHAVEVMSTPIAAQLIQRIGSPAVIRFLDLPVLTTVDACYVCRAPNGGATVRVVRAYDMIRDQLSYRADVVVEVIGPEANA